MASIVAKMGALILYRGCNWVLAKRIPIYGIEPALAPAELATGGKFVAAVTLFVLSCAALFLQLSTYPNHDVAWVLWGTRELLHGARWGRDVIEANPPLAWWLAMPTTALAEWANSSLAGTFRAAVVIVAAISAGSAMWLVPPNQSRLRPLAICATAGVAFLILPGREFGQREQLLAIALLPYLALEAHRYDRLDITGWRIPTFIGVIAGIGVALKPYFLAVPALVELLLQLFVRPRPRLMRPENVAGGLVLVTYVAWLLAFERPYLQEVIPLARTIYWEYNLPFERILPALLLQLIVAAPLIVLAAVRRDGFGIMLGAGWCGLAASYLIQQKGYAYHLLPVTMTTLLLMASTVTLRQLRPAFRWSVAILAVTFLWVICLPPLSRWWESNQTHGARTVEINRVRASLARHAPNGRWLSVAVHHHPAFPTAIFTSARYVSRTNSQWFLSAVVQIRNGQAAPPQASEIERHAREFILHDLRARPDLVLIDTNSARHTLTSSKFDFLAFFKEDPAFRSEWRSYDEIEPIGKFRQFVRKYDANPQPGKAKGSN